MTAAALGYHHRLVSDGVDPRSDEYYDKVNAYVRSKFPENFNEVEPTPPPSSQPTPRRTSNVVAPATRTTAPKKIQLSHSQVAVAKRLGVPLAEYAKHAAQLERK
jgi:hypothetical protein